MSNLSECHITCSYSILNHVLFTCKPFFSSSLPITMISFPLFSCLLATSLAAPTLQKRSTLSPSVTIQNGTVVGSSNGLIDTFLGIPFAEPPTGALVSISSQNNTSKHLHCLVASETAPLYHEDIWHNNSNCHADSMSSI